MTPEENAAIRMVVQETTMTAVREFDENKPRSTQTHIGPSEVGGCREFLRAKIAGDPQEHVPNTKWSAFIGTAVGDALEHVMSATRGAVTQLPVTYTLPRLGFEVSGSLDVLWPKAGPESEKRPFDNAVWDWKSKDGIDGVMRDGPQRKEWVQVSIYLLAALDAGYVDEDGIGTLAYYDRSGKDKQVWTQSVNVREARGWIEAAEERLEDVIEALANPAYGDGERHLRDEPEQQCWYFGCPFYAQCWTGYMPTDEITDQRLIGAMRQYDEGRELAKAAKKLQDEAKAALGVGEETPVVGASEEFSVDWRIRESRGLLVRTIDVRRKR